jgi:hypothetical protein
MAINDIEVEINIDVDMSGVESAITQIETLNERVNNANGSEIDIDGNVNPDANVQAGLPTESNDGGGSVDVVSDDDDDVRDMSFVDSLRNVVNSGDPDEDKIAGFEKNNLDMFDIRMETIHNLLADIVPLLGVLAFSMPIVSAGLQAVAGAAVLAAGALLGVAGLSIFGFGMAQDEDGGFPELDDFSSAFDQIKQDFFTAFAPIAEDLSSLTRDGLDAFGEMLIEIGDVLENNLAFLQKFAREAGRVIGDAIPAIVRGSISILRQFGDVLTELSAKGLDPTKLQRILDVIKNSMPTVTSLLVDVIDIIPALLKISEGFARVTDVILSLAGTILDFIDATIGLRNFGTIVGVILSLVSALALLSTTIGIVVGLGSSLATVASILGTSIGVLIAGAIAVSQIIGGLVAVLVAFKDEIVSIISAVSSMITSIGDGSNDLQPSPSSSGGNSTNGTSVKNQKVVNFDFGNESNETRRRSARSLNIEQRNTSDRYTQ